MKLPLRDRVLRKKFYLFLLFFLMLGGLFGGKVVDFHKLYIGFRCFSYSHPVYSIIIFFLFQLFVVLVGIFPASISVMGAGLVFGLAEGFCLAATAVLLGSVIAFYVSRTVLREGSFREIKKHKFFFLLERNVTNKGWKAVCLLRLSPILPFAVTNYAIGLTGISFGEYLIGTLFSLPALLGYVFIGSLTGNDASMSGNGHVEMVKIAIDAVFILSTAFILWFVGKVVFKYLEKDS